MACLYFISQVTPVTHPDKHRYSIFGWFLKEGKLYDLDVSKGGNLKNATGGLSDKEAAKARGKQQLGVGKKKGGVVKKKGVGK